MATTRYGTNATSILVTNPPAAIPSSDGGGRVRLIYDSYTFAADMADEDIILMGPKIPAGARVIDVMMKFTDLGANTGRLDVGWQASSDAVEAADLDGFMVAVDPGTAADIIKMSDNLTGATAAGMGKKFASAVQTQIRVETDTDAASGTIELFIQYALD